jgi:hypothetical protein
LETSILNQVFTYLDKIQEVDLANEVKKAKSFFVDEGKAVLTQSKRARNQNFTDR